MSPKNVLENGKIAPAQLEEIVSMALESLKTIMVHYETPLEMKVQVALKILETFGPANVSKSEDEIIHGLKNGLKKNGRDIETLLKLVAQKNQEARRHQEWYVQKDAKMIAD